MSIIACTIAVFNLFYNNLLLNLRFRAKITCFTTGYLVYELPNIICCHICLHSICRDRWGRNIVTPLKWIVKTVYFIILIAFIKAWKNLHESRKEWETLKLDIPIAFDDLLIVYLLQHLIFIGLRPLFFCIFLCISLGFDHGQPYEKED